MSKKKQDILKDLEKFKLAVENASDQIVITDPEGFIIYANAALKSITGYNPKDVIGLKAGNKNLWGGLMEPSFYKKMWKTIKEKKKVFKGELKNRKKNGAIYDSWAHISPVLNKKGNVLFFVSIERDITKQKEIDKAKSDFVSLVSHQLHTPLSTIRWYSEMLLDGDAGKTNKKQESFIKHIDKAVHKVIHLVNTILDLSHLESGKLTLKKIKLNPQKIINEILEEQINNIQEKNHSVIFQYKTKREFIHSDRRILREILNNIIGNAIKYTPENGKITIKASIKTTRLCFEIADNGYGIPISEQEKVFQKFFRAKNIIEKEAYGNGLGLHFVKQMIKALKGSISFKSEEDKGTTFMICIPYK